MGRPWKDLGQGEDWMCRAALVCEGLASVEVKVHSVK